MDIIKSKKIHILISILMLWFVTIGCKEESKKEHKQAKQVEEVKQAEKIEISVNENAQEIKVKEKKIDKSQDKSYYYDYNIKREYNPNAMPANKDASVRVKPRTPVEANIHIRSPYENVQVSLLVKKLSKTFRVKCSACHDDYANGVIGPSLLGRDSNYIYEKIIAFKNGKKSNPLMKDLVNMMSDEEIRSLSDEIYEFNKQIKQIREKK